MSVKAIGYRLLVIITVSNSNEISWVTWMFCFSLPSWSWCNGIPWSFPLINVIDFESRVRTAVSVAPGMERGWPVSLPFSKLFLELPNGSLRWYEYQGRSLFSRAFSALRPINWRKAVTDIMIVATVASTSYQNIIHCTSMIFPRVRKPVLRTRAIRIMQMLSERKKPTKNFCRNVIFAFQRRTTGTMITAHLVTIDQELRSKWFMKDKLRRSAIMSIEFVILLTVKVLMNPAPPAHVTAFEKNISLDPAYHWRSRRLTNSVVIVSTSHEVCWHGNTVRYHRDT